jgi:hypothetical protein
MNKINTIILILILILFIYINILPSIQNYINPNTVQEPFWGSIKKWVKKAVKKVKKTATKIVDKGIKLRLSKSNNRFNAKKLAEQRKKEEQERQRILKIKSLTTKVNNAKLELRNLNTTYTNLLETQNDITVLQTKQGDITQKF